MLGRIIPKPIDRHEAVRTLLPWYVTGQLEAADQRRIDDHLTGCEGCRAELATERRLSSEVAKLSLDVERGWATVRRRVLQDRLASTAKAWLRRPLRSYADRWWVKPTWIGFAMAAQLAVLLMTAGLLYRSSQQDRYHVLSSGKDRVVGNVVVMFAPGTTERDLRHLLQVNHARLVDGPTAAGAYVLSIPASERAATLSKLQHQSAIVLAEAVDTATAGQ